MKYLIVFPLFIGLSLIILTSCKQNETDPPIAPSCSDGIQNQGETGVDCGGPCPLCPITTIGANYGGGIVVYIDTTGQHGFVAALTDQSSGSPWASDYQITGATNEGDGMANTTRIVQYLGSGNYAAKICDDLILNGYNDWYLPAFGQLERMSNLDGFSSKTYWSSTERNYYFAEKLENGYGTIYGGGKLESHCVRAVRSF